MYFSLLQGQGTSCLTGRQRSAYRVHAGNDTLHIFIDLGKHRHANSRHDAHVHDNIRRIGQLNADLRDRRTDGTHAEGQHIHRAAPHRTAEERLQRLPHLKRVDPIVGGAGVVLRERADEGAILYARYIVRVRACVVSSPAKVLVQPNERAARDHLPAEIVVLLLRTVNPMNGSGLGKIRHLLDPSQEVLVLAERARNVTGRGCEVVVDTFFEILGAWLGVRKLCHGVFFQDKQILFRLTHGSGSLPARQIFAGHLFRALQELLHFMPATEYKLRTLVNVLWLNIQSSLGAACGGPASLLRNKCQWVRFV